MCEYRLQTFLSVTERERETLKGGQMVKKEINLPVCLCGALAKGFEEKRER